MAGTAAQARLFRCNRSENLGSMPAHGGGDMAEASTSAGHDGARTPEQWVGMVVMHARELRQIVGKMRGEEDIEVYFPSFLSTW